MEPTPGYSVQGPRGTSGGGAGQQGQKGQQQGGKGQQGGSGQQGGKEQGGKGQQGAKNHQQEAKGAGQKAKQQVRGRSVLPCDKDARTTRDGMRTLGKDMESRIGRAASTHYDESTIKIPDHEEAKPSQLPKSTPKNVNMEGWDEEMPGPRAIREMMRGGGATRGTTGRMPVGEIPEIPLPLEL